MSSKIVEIKKVRDGVLGVRYEGDPKFYIIDDEEIATYLVYLMVNGSDAVEPTRVPVAN